MARSGLARLADAVFEKDGKQIPYRTVRLTPAGRAANETTTVDFVMKDATVLPAAGKRKRKKKAAPKRSAPRAAATPRAAAAPVDTRLEEALRAWRLSEARKRGVPAFRIFTDQALRAIAKSKPATAAELLAVPGIGIGTIEKYGQRILQNSRTSSLRVLGDMCAEVPPTTACGGKVIMSPLSKVEMSS